MTDYYYCAYCSGKVGDSDEAVSCDLCSKWQHRICDTGPAKGERPPSDSSSEREATGDFQLFGGAINTELANLDTDLNSLSLMRNSGIESADVPVVVSGDGNCLFNAVSIALTGNETLAAELRLRTAVDMVTNGDIHESRADRVGLLSCSPSYQDALNDCIVNGSYSCVWTMISLAVVVGKPIQSLYPTMNDHTATVPGILNKVFPSPNCGVDPVVLLWTRGTHKHIHPADKKKPLKAEISATVLRCIREKLPSPIVEAFVLDFEKGVWKAIREVFPGTVIKSCVFHWVQAVWRNVQNNGLQQTYHDNEGVYRYIRQLMALPFLPAVQIEDAFNSLKPRAERLPQLVSLVNYMDRQWFRNTVFGVADWSVFPQSVRTNNDVEGWHHRLNLKAGMAGLGLYRLVPLLRREADLVQLNVTAADLERDLSRMTSKLDKQLHDAWDKYMDGELSTSQFLRTVAQLYGPKDY